MVPHLVGSALAVASSWPLVALVRKASARPRSRVVVESSVLYQPNIYASCNGRVTRTKCIYTLKATLC